MGESELPGPGWFADPHRAAWLRYWDGRQWTDHTALDATAATDVDRLVADARRARIAIAVGVPVQAVAAVGQVHQVRQSRRVMQDTLDRIEEIQRFQARQGSAGGTYTVVESRPLMPVGSSLSLPTLVVGILFLIWFHRAAGLAARLRRPARRSPSWAVVGWLIPVVNFVFPFRSALDMFRPADHRRAVVRPWWAAYLVALLAVQLFTTLAGFGEDHTGAVLVAVGALAFVLWQLAYFHARTFIDTVTQSLAGEARSGP